ncbi:activator protein [Chitinivorax sp. B]|uniref:activator protein n=1 Tax=Chitinivorax sp. B TaxID=2502235 RepID=UPI0010F991AD|nr:activator protein [Chitinivorax sp. B]
MNRITLYFARWIVVPCFHLAIPAFGITITPPGAGGMAIPFSAVGPASVSKSGVGISCTAVFNGTVDGGGNLRITSAAFSGSSLCRVIKANATSLTPWTGRVDSISQLTIDNASVDVRVILVGGICGPSKISAQITDNESETVIGLNNANLAGNCTISGTLSTTPYLHVTP